MQKPKVGILEVVVVVVVLIWSTGVNRVRKELFNKKSLLTTNREISPITI